MAAPDPTASPAGQALPKSALRLFPNYEAVALAGEPARSLVIARLLEDGTEAELRWLFATLGEEPVAAWVARHGARSLSRRSRAFWSLLLGIPEQSASTAARELWPLA